MLYILNRYLLFFASVMVVSCEWHHISWRASVPLRFIHSNHFNGEQQKYKFPIFLSNSLCSYLPFPEQPCIHTSAVQTRKWNTLPSVLIPVFTSHLSFSLFSVYSSRMWELNTIYYDLLPLLLTQVHFTNRYIVVLYICNFTWQQGNHCDVNFFRHGKHNLVYPVPFYWLQHKAGTALCIFLSIEYICSYTHMSS